MNIQMKQRYIFSVLLLLCSACQQEEWAQPEADSSDAIRFAAPSITVEKLTRSTFHNAFPTGGTFGVLGYCVPYQRGSDTEMDWASGSAYWGNKSGNAFPDVFFNKAVTYDGSACTYNFENSGGPRKWYNTTDDAAATSPDSYRYTFFAYYPMDAFTVESPASATTRGVPKLTFTMPFTETGDVATELDDTQTSDAMVSVVYNHLRTTGNVGFNFSHIMTGLGFAVNNYNYGGDDETVTVKKVTLSGNFTRSITIDFSKNTNEDGFYTYSGTYPGTYAIYNNEEGLAVAPNSSVPLIGDRHLLLLSNATDGTYFGKDVKVQVEYIYGRQEKIATAERPSQFQPRAGVRYTAQLNFVGETFALNFIAADNEFWEDGGDSDVSIQ